MRKTDHLLDRLNEVEVPDVWTNIGARRPGPMLPPPERRQRPLVIAVALIVSIASLVLVTRAFDRQTTTGPATTPSPTTAAENVTITKAGTLDVSGLGGLTAAEEAFGSLWIGVITDSAGTEIVRVDPTSGATQHRFPVAGWDPGEWGGRGIVIGGGMVWIPGRENGQATITRIDPATNETTVLRLTADSIAYLAFGSDGTLWANIGLGNSTAIAQIDPQTGLITHTWPFTADWALEICEAQGNVWVHEMNTSNSTVHGGWLAQVVPGSAHQVTTGGTFAGPVCSADGVWTAINGDEKAVNLANGIAEVDPSTGAIMGSWSTPPIGYDMALDGAGGVWFLTANSGGQIERLDPSTGAIDAKETVGGTPIFISSSSDHIWVGTYEGRLIRFDIAPSASASDQIPSDQIVQQTIVVNQGAADGSGRIVFAPPPDGEIDKALSAAEALAVFENVDPQYKGASGSTPLLGSYTTFGGQYANRFAWGFSSIGTCPPSPNPFDLQSPAGECTNWLFLDAYTGKMLEAVAAPIAPNSGQLTHGAFGDPCDRLGQPTDLATASKVGYTLFAPHDSIADSDSPASLTGVRTCPGNEVEMRFSSGVTVLQELNSISDPGKAWERLASADPTSTSVGTVQGQPAALIQPVQGALGSVTVVLDGTIVWVVGDGQIPITDLQRVAESLQPA